MSLLRITTEISSEIDVQSAQCLDERINDWKELVLAQDICIEWICRPLPKCWCRSNFCSTVLGTQMTEVKVSVARTNCKFRAAGRSKTEVHSTYFSIISPVSTEFKELFDMQITVRCAVPLWRTVRSSILLSEHWWFWTSTCSSVLTHRKDTNAGMLPHPDNPMFLYRTDNTWAKSVSL